MTTVQPVDCSVVVSLMMNSFSLLFNCIFLTLELNEFANSVNFSNNWKICFVFLFALQMFLDKSIFNKHILCLWNYRTVLIYCLEINLMRGLRVLTNSKPLLFIAGFYCLRLLAACNSCISAILFLRLISSTFFLKVFWKSCSKLKKKTVKIL